MIGDGECKAYFEKEKHKKKINLNDDEKAILRHIRKSWNTIGRKLGGALYLGENRGIDSTFEDFFTGIFEWIQYRRRI